MHAKFISLDGIDGAGKSTHLATLRHWFAQRQLPVLFTREPGGTPLGETLRQLLLDPQNRIHLRSETLLMFAARAQHIEEVIRPALAAGTHVVSDRFSDATFAYQGGGRGLPLADIQMLADWVQQGLQPDLTLLLDVPLDVARQRIDGHRDQDRFEQEDTGFFERTRAVYRQRAAAAPERYAVIDSSQPPQAVAEQVTAALNRLFGPNT